MWETERQTQERLERERLRYEQWKALSDEDKAKVKEQSEKLTDFIISLGYRKVEPAVNRPMTADKLVVQPLTGPIPSLVFCPRDIRYGNNIQSNTKSSKESFFFLRVVYRRIRQWLSR